MIVSAIGLELSIGAKRANAMCAATRKTAEVSATLTVAATCFFFKRNHHPAGGPISSAMAARDAGRRSAANDAPVRSKRWDIESV